MVNMSVSRFDWNTVVHGVRLFGETDLCPSFDPERTWTHELHVQFEASARNAPADATSAAHDATPVARCVHEGETEYAFSIRGATLHFTFPGFCWGAIDQQTRRAIIHAANPDDAALVFPNTVLSVMLGAGPDVVLHASAVVSDEVAIAICGPSGSGKSTIAAALTLAGARLVTDDALRIDLSDGAVARCYPGVPELRLRQTRGWPLNPSLTRVLTDERLGYRPSQPVDVLTPLGALIFPNVSPEHATPTLTRLRGERGARQLLGASRIAWTGTSQLEAFRNLLQLSRLVPAYQLDLPPNYCNLPDNAAALVQRLHALVHQGS